MTIINEGRRLYCKIVKKCRRRKFESNRFLGALCSRELSMEDVANCKEEYAQHNEDSARYIIQSLPNINNQSNFSVKIVLHCVLYSILQHHSGINSNMPTTYASKLKIFQFLEHDSATRIYEICNALNKNQISKISIQCIQLINILCYEIVCTKLVAILYVIQPTSRWYRTSFNDLHKQQLQKYNNNLKT